jgi:histidine triad (HIT) family protein
MVLFETSLGLIIEPLDPVTTGHVLVLPKQHVEDLSAAGMLGGDMATLASIWARGRYPSYNVITSVGAAATQTVRHLHWHIVPRDPNDGLPLPWTPQQEHAAST